MVRKYDRVASAASFFSRISTHEVDVIERFKEEIFYAERAANRRLAKVEKDANQDYIETLIEDRDVLLNDITPLADKLAIVALYRIVELNTKRILARCWSKTKVKKCYQIEALKTNLQSDFQIDLTTIAHYDEIDELRELNNKVKHERRETKPWQLGAFERLAPVVPVFVRALAKAVLPFSRR